MDQIGDLSKLKVAELKKQLKNRGLFVTGNKTELVERLQTALLEDGGNLDSGGDLDEDEFDEEEILAGEDEEEEEDIGKITPQEEDAVLSGGATSIRVKPVTSLMVDSGEKKISLKRSEPCLSAPAEISSSSNVQKSEVKSTTTPVSTENSVNEEPKHKIIKISAPESSTESVLEARAKKFGVTASDSDEKQKAARVARFGSTTTANKSSKLSMETGDVNIETLKKRAERFGEVTSKSLSKLEIDEKIKQRQNRFGEATPEAGKILESKDLTSTTAKDARAERFNTKTVNGSTKKESEDDAKQKRAERFGK